MGLHGNYGERVDCFRHCAMASASIRSSVCLCGFRDAREGTMDEATERTQTPSRIAGLLSSAVALLTAAGKIASRARSGVHWGAGGNPDMSSKHAPASPEALDFVHACGFTGEKAEEIALFLEGNLLRIMRESKTKAEARRELSALTKPLERIASRHPLAARR